MSAKDECRVESDEGSCSTILERYGWESDIKWFLQLFNMSVFFIQIVIKRLCEIQLNGNFEVLNFEVSKFRCSCSRLFTRRFIVESEVLKTWTNIESAIERRKEMTIRLMMFVSFHKRSTKARKHDMEILVCSDYRICWSEFFQPESC